MQLKNVAAVMVTAQLPPFAQPGQAIDVTVSSLGNAKSLRGGTLIATPLKGADGQIYALAQGNLVVGGAGAAAGGSQGADQPPERRPRARAARTVERACRRRCSRASSLQLDLNATDFTHRARVARADQPRQWAPAPRRRSTAASVRVRMPADAGRARGLPRRHREPARSSWRAPAAKVVHQRAHRLGGDEPGGHAGRLRGRARQPVGDDQLARRWSASPAPFVAAARPWRAEKADITINAGARAR